ncbi:50S ribosomal protein L3 [candidate division GN15 bacterium]|uniref:Large ribosomal subunit protein uL3 n=1 Tax=candidate division GN15 bacterium TaxID=2072418 RepID=A0A855XAL2_9BACT|nr:MAG: 50S ribosomal protein L3 [candidate division GN15 bacterium]
MKEILGKKIGMTRIFKETGEMVPVTVIEAGPCPVIAKRPAGKRGASYQVGFGTIRTKLVNKPKAGHFAKAGIEPTRWLRQIRYDDAELEIGAQLKVDIFKEGEKVDVTGISRGLGFQGAVKLHHFGGGPKTHGQSDRRRAPGSVGSSSYPSRVFKGMRMAAKMGKERVTALNLSVAKIIAEQNLLLVEGSIPGVRGALVKVRLSNRKK